MTLKLFLLDTWTVSSCISFFLCCFAVTNTTINEQPEVKFCKLLLPHPLTHLQVRPYILLFLLLVVIDVLSRFLAREKPFICALDSILSHGLKMWFQQLSPFYSGLSFPCLSLSLFPLIVQACSYFSYLRPLFSCFLATSQAFLSPLLILVWPPQIF